MLNFSVKVFRQEVPQKNNSYGWCLYLALLESCVSSDKLMVNYLIIFFSTFNSIQQDEDVGGVFFNILIHVIEMLSLYFQNRLIYMIQICRYKQSRIFFKDNFFPDYYICNFILKNSKQEATYVCIMTFPYIAMRGKFDDLSCNPTSIISFSLFLDLI